MSQTDAIPGHELLVPDAATLLRDLPIEPGKVRSRRLYKTADVTVLGVAMDAGTVMREHVAPVPILVHVVDGGAVLEVGQERTDLPAGAIIHVAGQVRHAVEALVPTRFLLLLLGTA